MWPILSIELKVTQSPDQSSFSMILVAASATQLSPLSWPSYGPTA